MGFLHSYFSISYIYNSVFIFWMREKCKMRQKHPLKLHKHIPKFPSSLCKNLSHWFLFQRQQLTYTEIFWEWTTLSSFIERERERDMSTRECGGLAMHRFYVKVARDTSFANVFISKSTFVLQRRTIRNAREARRRKTHSLTHTYKHTERTELQRKNI